MSRCGVVTRVEGDEVWVEIERTSACSGCHSKSSCMAMTGETTEVIKIKSSRAASFSEGDSVRVKVDKGSARLSVILAYVVPLVVLMLVLVLFNLLGLSDDAAGVSIVVFLVIYYYVLYLFRGKFEKKMSFKIEK